MEGKVSMQKVAPEDFQSQIFQERKELEEQKTKEALEQVKRKHILVRWKCERERARMIQEPFSLEISVIRHRVRCLWCVGFCVVFLVAILAACAPSFVLCGCRIHE